MNQAEIQAPETAERARAESCDADRMVECGSIFSISDRRIVNGVSVEVTSRQAAVAHILSAMRARSCEVFAFCNMHGCNLARRSPAFASALGRATVFNDGIGMDIASRILFGRPFPENINGTDLTPELLAGLERPTAVFLLGSPPGVAERAARALESRFPQVRVVGCQHGFFPPSEDGEMADRVRRTGAELVLAGMGNPRQELWAVEMAPRTGAVVLCIGAFLDFASGRVSRAPRLVRALRSEWLYRLALEPRRLASRYFGGVGPFLWAVLRERLRRPALPGTSR
ncbi:WecB/TagA/CpsF family glycosyltransferase [Roseomonas sp. BN140053]|uniref:WecB/TagA/CpsF family glycosyltransferase n=1 Tax=Roseomonas sp. BN140053 TaxID=3391898 RepID=UPI0039EC0FAE